MDPLVGDGDARPVGLETSFLSSCGLVLAVRALTQNLLPQGQGASPALFTWEVGDARLVGSGYVVWLPRVSLLVLPARTALI